MAIVGDGGTDLPECDRCFTRSDALAKHMRTVHETEALRPSDPIPRNHSNPPSRPPRIKLILSARPPEARANGDDDTDDMDEHGGRTSATGISNGSRPVYISEPWPSDLQLTAEESGTAPHELFRLLRRQLHWAQEERHELRREVEALEKKKKREWQEKELLLENVMEAELAHHSSGIDGMSNRSRLKLLPERGLPMTGPLPWYGRIGLSLGGSGSRAPGHGGQRTMDMACRVSSLVMASQTKSDPPSQIQ